MDYLDLEDLLQLAADLEAGPVRDLGLLEASVARPRTTLFGEDTYPTLELKTAALLHSLARNQPLVDGNMRLAWLATVVFLDINGVRVEFSQDEGFELTMAVAEGTLDLAEIAARLAA